MRRLLVLALLMVCGSLSAAIDLVKLQESIWPVVDQARKTTVAVNALGSTGVGWWSPPMASS